MTDEQIQKFKEEAYSSGPIIWAGAMKLIERLKAAEAVCLTLQAEGDGMMLDDAMEAWRRVAGKEGA